MSGKKATVSAVGIIVDSTMVMTLDTLPEPAVFNGDAQFLIDSVKEHGGYALMAGPIFEADAGVLGGWSPDLNGLYLLLDRTHARLNEEIPEKFSEWMVLTDAAVSKRIQKRFKKLGPKYH